jgi:hypothetical protein
VADANLFPDEAGFSSRPAWQVIEAARRRYLTGELTLPTTPATRIFLRDGLVYFAERSSDGTLPIRLMVEGVITREQMQRGTVIVNGVEHMGRLFDSDPSIDRASVELCVELFTDDVMIAVANEVVPSYELTLYRRHPSGIDRWYPHSVPVTGRHGDTPDQSAAKRATSEVEAAAAAAANAAAAKPKPRPQAQASEAQQPPPQRIEERQPNAQPASKAEVRAPQNPEPAPEPKTEPRNNLNAPPITQAVPVTARSTAPPPPITQAVPTISPITMQVPLANMPPPTTQIPVTAPKASTEVDAAAIADEVAAAIKRAFAGMGSDN